MMKANLSENHKLLIMRLGGHIAWMIQQRHMPHRIIADGLSKNYTDGLGDALGKYRKMTESNPSIATKKPKSTMNLWLRWED